MYAVVKTGGKQYRVAKDDVIIVEKLKAEPGATVELDQVLALDDGSGPQLGTPLVDGARVAATVLDQSRGEKVLVFRKLRRKDFHRLKGHRQDQTVLRITDILPKGAKASAKTAAAPAEKPAVKPAEAAADAAVEDKAAAPAKKAAKKAAKKTAKKSAKKAAKKSAKKSAKKAAKKAGKKSAAKKSAD